MFRAIKKLLRSLFNELSYNAYVIDYEDEQEGIMTCRVLPAIIHQSSSLNFRADVSKNKDIVRRVFVEVSSVSYNELCDSLESDKYKVINRI